LQDGLGDLVRREDRLQAFDEGVPVDALARGVAGDPDRADAAGRCQLRKQRDEPNVQPGPLRLVGRVPADVPRGCGRAPCAARPRR
jgi:hypothetical protein